MIEVGYTLLFQAFLAILSWRFLWPQLPPIARRTGLVLFLCQVTLFLLYAYSRFVVGVDRYTKWLFNLNTEASLAATFSTIQIVLVACISGTSAFLIFRTSRKLAFFWLTICLGFYLLAIDEYFGLHEELHNLGWFYRLGGALFFLWLCHWAWRSRSESRLFILLPTGLAMAAFGALVLDRLPYTRIGTKTFWNMPLEEALEMFGVLMVLIGSMSLLFKNYLRHNWRRGGGIFLSLILLTIVLFVTLILTPRIELKVLGKRVHVTFYDDAFWLRGYRLSKDDYTAGQPLTIRLYINSTKPKFMSTGLSLHLVDQKTRESVAAVNRHFSILHWHRIMGRTYRQSVTIDIPADLPANHPYWLLLTLWDEAGGSFNPLIITTSDQQQLSDTQVVLHEFVIPSEAKVSVPDDAGEFRFENGFTLFSAELTEMAHPGETIAIPMVWQAESDGEDDFVQFLHFFHEESGNFWNHDQPPLGTRLPTRLWYEGLRDTETWQFTLPEDLAPGRYAIYTGLYRLSDLERLPVADEYGVSFPDARVPLGYLTIRE